VIVMPSRERSKHPAKKNRAAARRPAKSAATWTVAKLLKLAPGVPIEEDRKTRLGRVQRWLTMPDVPPSRRARSRSARHAK